MALNKNISVWRGNNTPPTDYHLWEKEDGSLFTKINEGWVQLTSPSDKITLDKLNKLQITKVESSDPNILYSYQLQSEDDVFGTIIDIPKDKSLKDVQLGYSNSSVDPETGTIDVGTPQENELSPQYMIYSIVVSDGTFAAVKVDLSSFITDKEYSDGLALDGNKLKVQIDPTSENYLSVSSEGIKLDGIKSEFNSILGNVSEEYNTLEKIENKLGNVEDEIEGLELTTNVVKVSESIPVTGGPLADQLNKYDIDSIDSDISMQDLLTMLFTKEIFPTPQYTRGSVSASIAAPSFTLNYSNLVEVNTPITVSACTPTSTTYSTSSRKLYGLTYGYSEDGIIKNTANNIIKSATNITSVGTYSITRTGVNGTESKSGSNVSDIKLDSAIINAKEGVNEVKVSITGVRYQGTFGAIPSVYIVSNLKKTSEKNKTSSYAEETIVSNTPSNYKSLSVTGLYPIYVNSISISELKVKSLEKNQDYKISFPAETSTEKVQFAIQKNKSVTIKMYNSVSGKYEDYPTSKFSTKSITLQSGGQDTEYILYTRNDGTTFSDSSSFEIIIK